MVTCFYQFFYIFLIFLSTDKSALKKGLKEIVARVLNINVVFVLVFGSNIPSLARHHPPGERSIATWWLFRVCRQSKINSLLVNILRLAQRQPPRGRSTASRWLFRGCRVAGHQEENQQPSGEQYNSNGLKQQILYII